MRRRLLPLARVLASVAASPIAVGVAQPGWYWNTTTSAVQPQPIETDDVRLRAALRSTLNRFDRLHRLHATAQRGHASAVIALGHDYLFRGSQGLYLVVTESNYSLASRLTYCERMEAGPMDMDANDSSFWTALDKLPEVPTGPVSWVNPSTNARVAIFDDSRAVLSRGADGWPVEDRSWHHVVRDEQVVRGGHSMSVLRIGDRITEESVFPAGVSEVFAVVNLTQDGGRRIIPTPLAANTQSLAYDRA